MLLPVCTQAAASGWKFNLAEERKMRNIFVPAQKEERNRQAGGQTSEVGRSLGGATDLLRLVLGGEQNRVWELRTLPNGEFMWRQFPPTHRPLLALHHLLCRNLSRSDRAGRHTFSTDPLLNAASCAENQML